MSDAKSHGSTQLARLPTGIRGLDAVLHGGVFVGGVYLVLGKPGTGKTILSSEIAYRHVAGGGGALYVTLLAETHSRMIAHLRSFRFFDAEVIARSLFYLSAYQVLEKEKLQGVLKLIKKSVKELRADLLVIDGVVTTGLSSDGELALKKFVHELKAFVETVGCTVFILSSAPGPGTSYPAQPMVDGILLLTVERVGLRTVRLLEVPKLRGSASLGGAHFFEIDDGGVHLHARMGTRLAELPISRAEEPPVRTSGVPALDAMLGGGFRSGSTTVLLGAPGSGKTLLGLAFLAEGARRRERGMYLGFSEDSARLVAKGTGIGLKLREPIKRGVIVVESMPPLELQGDAIVEAAIDLVIGRKIQRFVLDGVDGLARGMVYPERAEALLTAFSLALRRVGVTSMFTKHAGQTLGPAFEAPPDVVTMLADNILLLRYGERQGRLHRLVSIIKVREGDYDTSIRAFSIGRKGFDIGAIFHGAEQVASDRRFDTDEVPPSRRGGSGKQEARKRR